METSASPDTGRVPSQRRLYFSLGALLIAIFCIAGLFAGYRLGANRGYIAGEQQRAAERLITRVYPVEDLVLTESGEQDFDSLIELVTTTIDPNTWDDVGGPGSIKELSINSTVVISQTADIHAEVGKLLKNIRAVPRTEGVRAAPPPIGFGGLSGGAPAAD